ncbi:DUF1353 domain-containing protein [Homoserinimonas sp. A520]
MPFIDEGGEPLRVIPLTQAPATGHYFQLVRPIGFREDDSSETHWVPAHIPATHPEQGNRTDLASVPWLFRAFIASYGRQSAPAIMHDHRRGVTSRLGSADAFSHAEEDDRLFRVGLRHQKVPLLRSWLMWATVSVEAYLLYARSRACALILQAVLGLAVIYASVVLSFGSPLWLLGVALPAIAAIAWGRRYVLLLWLSYGFALLAPLVLLQLCSLAPYWLAELLVREVIDRPFIDPEPGPVAVPFGRAP